MNRAWEPFLRTGFYPSPRSARVLAEFEAFVDVYWDLIPMVDVAGRTLAGRLRSAENHFEVAQILKSRLYYWHRIANPTILDMWRRYTEALVRQLNIDDEYGRVF